MNDARNHPLIQVSPSLLAADPLNLATEVEAVQNAGAERLHIDIMDGHFVPNLSFGPALLAPLKKQTPLPLDVHLMVDPVERFIDMFLDENLDTLTFHLEGVDDPTPTLQQIRVRGKQAGLALKPGTCWKSCLPYFPYLDLILVMTVEPGFGGQAFIPATLEKIKYLSHATADQDIQIHVDGGITQQNAYAVASAGADVLIAGSEIFKYSPYTEVIQKLKNPQ